MSSAPESEGRSEVRPDVRPPSPEERRTRILTEAAAIFYDKGYERACIDDLIAKVGGSKRTIYNEFGNKEGLFVAMVEMLVKRHARRLVDDLEADVKSGASLRQLLLDYGSHMMDIIMHPDVLAFYRTLIAEGKRFPRLPETYHTVGPARSIARLSEILAHHRDKGEIVIEDPRLAAEQFGGLIRDSHYFAVLLGVLEPPDPAEKTRRVTTAVDLFLKGVAPRG